MDGDADPAGWLADDTLTTIGTTTYSVWYLALLVLGVTLLRSRSGEPTPAKPDAHLVAR